MFQEVLHIIDAISRHPLFITSTALIIGKLLIEKWSYQKVKTDAKREKSIEFIEEVANLLNLAISETFDEIRKSNEDHSRDIENQTMPYISDLFFNRFNIRIKSTAYLDSEVFWKEYERLMYNLRDIYQLILQADNREITGIIEIIEAKKAEISAHYSFDDFSYTENLDSPYDELVSYNSIIFKAANQILSQELSKLLTK